MPTLHRNYYRTHSTGIFEYAVASFGVNHSVCSSSPSCFKRGANYSARYRSSDSLFWTEPITILGAGSIGLLWAASIRLNFPSYRVRVITNRPHNGVGSSKGLMDVCLRRSFNLDAGETQPDRRPLLVQIPFSYRSVSLSGCSCPARNLVVCTKAFQAVNAVESIIDQIDDRTRVILLCNGVLAVRAELDALFGRANIQPRLYTAMTTHGVYRDVDEVQFHDLASMNGDAIDKLHHVVHAGYGTTLLEDFPEMATLWDKAGLNCRSVSTHDLARQLWFKLSANCVINPISLLNRCLNGSVPKVEGFYEMRDEILREVATVYLLTEYQTRINAFDFHCIVTAMREYVDLVIQTTAQNKSSMLQDFLAHRPTEIDYLSGFIVRKGQELGVSCPRNKELWLRVKELCT